MIYASLIVTSMGVFAAVAAGAFAWSVVSGQFGDTDRAAASIFWDERRDGGVDRG